jgi:hypothetical protein
MKLPPVDTLVVVRWKIPSRYRSVGAQMPPDDAAPARGSWLVRLRQ